MKTKKKLNALINERKNMKKALFLILALCMTLALCACGSQTTSPAAEPQIVEKVVEVEKAAAPGSNVVILFTNDMHCGVNDNITVKGLADMKYALEASGKQVLLVDCGDAVQGDSIGTLSQGEYIIDIMNELGYDVAIPGNHEFDYTVDQFLNLVNRAEYPYVSANFVRTDGTSLLDPYVIIEADGAKIAFVGASTPKTLVTSTPIYFQDENGAFIYSFCQDSSGEAFYTAIQNAVDSARGEGADYVFLLAHLGIEAECAPYMSTDLITHTTGIDAVLDGHSHSVIEKESVKNALGQNVLLCSTGTKLANIGCLTINQNGEINTTLINDNGVRSCVDGINAQFDELLNTVVAHTDVSLCLIDPLTGERMVRSNETNLGDLCADAYRFMSGADIAIVNSGAIRAEIPVGDITYDQIIAVHPYANELCVIEITGQELLDALEYSVSKLPGEFGGFLHVSGMSFTVDVSVKSGVVVDTESMFASVEGERRIKDVMIGDEPLDPAKVYTLASHNYEFKSMGDGYSMFADNNFLADSVMIDNQVLINYIVEGLGGVVGEDYADPYGQGRITIIGG